MTTKRVNLTQHDATPEQWCGLPVDAERVRELLTFETLPSWQEIEAAAWELAAIASEAGATEAMIGGAPYLMPELERALRASGVTPLYAFSRRESVEETQADGSIRKVNIFRHLGFVCTQED